MPVVTGQNAQLAMLTEATWGSSTGLAASKASWPPFQTAEWEPVKEEVTNENINSAPSKSDVIYGRQRYTARFRSNMDYDNFIIPLRHALGDASNVPSGAAHIYTYSLQTELPTGINFNVDHSETGGWGWELIGGKIISATFSMDEGGGLISEFDMRFKDGPYLDAPRFSNDQQVSELVTADDVSTLELFGVGTVCVQSISLRVENPIDEEQGCIGGDGSWQSEPGRAGSRDVTLDCSVVMENTSHWTLIESGSTGDFTWTMDGSSANGCTVTLNKLRFTAPKMKIKSWNESIDGAGRIVERFQCQLLQNSTSNDELAALVQNGTDITV